MTAGSACQGCTHLLQRLEGERYPDFFKEAIVCRAMRASGGERSDRCRCRHPQASCASHAPRSREALPSRLRLRALQSELNEQHDVAVFKKLPKQHVQENPVERLWGRSLVVEPLLHSLLGSMSAFVRRGQHNRGIYVNNYRSGSSTPWLCVVQRMQCMPG
jgi:hypothetical protein